MPPDPEAFEGPAAIVGYLEAAIFSRPSDQRLRLAPTMASGQPAFIVMESDPATGRLRRIGLMVLSVRGRYVGEIRGYMRADLGRGAEPFPQQGQGQERCRDAGREDREQQGTFQRSTGGARDGEHDAEQRAGTKAADPVDKAERVGGRQRLAARPEPAAGDPRRSGQFEAPDDQLERSDRG